MADEAEKIALITSLVEEIRHLNWPDETHARKFDKIADALELLADIAVRKILQEQQS